VRSGKHRALPSHRHPVADFQFQQLQSAVTGFLQRRRVTVDVAGVDSFDIRSADSMWSDMHRLQSVKHRTSTAAAAAAASAGSPIDSVVTVARGDSMVSAVRGDSMVSVGRGDSMVSASGVESEGREDSMICEPQVEPVLAPTGTEASAIRHDDDSLSGADLVV
jgi:hypothetical protein